MANLDTIKARMYRSIDEQIKAGSGIIPGTEYNDYPSTFILESLNKEQLEQVKQFIKSFRDYDDID